MFRHHYSRFLGTDPRRLHFAAHSHHPWPDATRAAQLGYWDDSARWIDDKWQHIFQEIVPRAQRNIAGALGLKRPEDIALAPSTHELVARLISCFDLSRPFRVLTTDGEFHSMARQFDRLAELPTVDIVRIPVQPFSSFASRFKEALGSATWDFVYFSHVFFNSGFVVAELEELADALAGRSVPIVIDGYHAFCALPVDLGAIEDRVFYVGGGYKYAQAGEGICFMSLPQDCRLRPLHTGWFASFGTLEASRPPGASVAYSDDAFRFWGATFDPTGAYRLNAVFEWMDAHQITVAGIHEHVQGIQRYFLQRLAECRGGSHVFTQERILHADLDRQGHFLAFEVPDAATYHQMLRERHVVVDRRGDVIRFGFGLYHERDDIDRLIEALNSIQVLSKS